jgi:hypothetical protein
MITSLLIDKLSLFNLKLVPKPSEHKQDLHVTSQIDSRKCSLVPFS